MIDIIGGNSQGGSYVLRITVRQPSSIVFGRFNDGQPISLPMGEYAYVGSALATKGPMSLGRRLVRHATRSGDREPQNLRDTMVEHFAEAGLGQGDLLLRNGKSLYWNVDHLLDRLDASLIGVIVIRSMYRLEEKIAALLEADSHTFIPATGLGANDSPGATHILGVQADETWWHLMVSRLSELVESD